MIGNENDAAAAVRGAGYFTSGTTRSVHLINGVIYKVDTDCDSANQHEYQNYLDFLTFPNVPDNINVPVTSLYMVDNEPVIAMEFIEGQPMAECFCLEGEGPYPECIPDNMLGDINRFIDDTGGMNVVLSNGIYYIVDIAY